MASVATATLRSLHRTEDATGLGVFLRMTGAPRWRWYPMAHRQMLGCRRRVAAETELVAIRHLCRYQIRWPLGLTSGCGPMPSFDELSRVIRQRILAVWDGDRSLAKTFDQIRRAERAKERLAALHAARRTARRSNRWRY